MYEDDDLWPIKCSYCLNEFTEKIGRIKTTWASRCPECGTNLSHPDKQFLLALAQAEAGILDP